MGPLNSPSDPLEACLLGTLDKGVEVQPGDEREIYAHILDMTPLFPPSTPSKGVRPFKDNKKYSPAVELKSLPSHLRYEFLGPNETFSVIINASLDGTQITKLLSVLRKHRGAIGYSIYGIKGISPSFCMHRILFDDEHCPSRQPQRRLKTNMQEVVKKEVVKLLNAEIIYPISDSDWVSPVQVVPKKGGMTIVKNERNELISTRTVTGWRMCIDYRKLNDTTRKDHFPLPFIDQILERLAGHSLFCYLDGYSGFF